MARCGIMNTASQTDCSTSDLTINVADEVSLWRGRYIEEFAMAEAAVSEALAFLSTIASEGAGSLLPHLVGQRFEALQAVVGAGGPFASVGGRVVKALDDFREHQRYRTFLCHASSEIAVDRSNEWTVTLHLTSFRSRSVERATLYISQSEAASLLERLRNARHRLDGQLCGLLASFCR